MTAVPDQLDAVEVETGPAPRAAVIWMHGLGADGHDFEPIVPELSLDPTRPVRFVFPHAPMQPVSLNRGMVMRSWYDIREDRGQLSVDAAGVRESQRRVEALIARETRRGVAADSVILAGFSQGGAMALHTGLRYPARLAGIMALSCYVPLARTLTAETNAANRDVPIFMAHGIYDDLIPIARARQSRDLLLGLGYRVEWREYPMPHSVSGEEVADISRWLRGALLRK